MGPACILAPIRGAAPLVLTGSHGSSGTPPALWTGKGRAWWSRPSMVGRLCRMVAAGPGLLEPRPPPAQSDSEKKVSESCKKGLDTGRGVPIH